MYGLDAELYLKENQRREENKGLEIQLGNWIETTIGEPLVDKEDLWVSLKSGVVLCKLVNKIKPGTITAFNTTRLLPLLEMDNIQIYLKALWQLGVNSRDLFVTPDLYKKKGMAQVLQSIKALSALAPKLGYKGPLIGDVTVKDEPKKVRSWQEFDALPNQLAEGSPDKVIEALEKSVLDLTSEIKAIEAEHETLRAEIVTIKAGNPSSPKPSQKEKERQAKLDDIWASYEAPLENRPDQELAAELKKLQTSAKSLTTDLNSTKAECAKIKSALTEREEALTENNGALKSVQERAAYCYEPPDGVALPIPVDPKLEQAQIKLKALLNAGASSTMDASVIGVLNAFVTSETGRRAFIFTIAAQLPPGELQLTVANFQLMKNLLVNMLGEMFISNSLDFQTMSVVMDTCQRIYHQEDAKKPRKMLQKEQEIRTYFGQLPVSFWEEFFWHKLTESYKKGGQETEREDGEKSDKWTIGLLLEFSWEMSSWGMEMNQVREVTNEVAYFGMGLDNAALTELLSSIESYIRQRASGQTSTPSTEVAKKTKGAVLETLATIPDGKKREKRYFVLTPKALVSFKAEKNSAPLSYCSLHPEVVVNSTAVGTPDEWPLTLTDPELEDSQITILFATKEQRNEWANCISRIITGAEEGLTSRAKGEEFKRVMPASSTAVTLSGGSLSLRDVLSVTARTRALPGGPRFNQPVDALAVNSCSLGKYMSTFFDGILKQTVSLTSLSLVNCGLADKGAILVARLLGGNSTSMCLPSLTKLDLERNNITKLGASRLSMAIAFNTSLVEVNLSLNPIQDFGAKAWCDCLRNNAVLKSLLFLVCGLTDKSVQMFLKVMDQFREGDDATGLCAELGCIAPVEAAHRRWCVKHKPVSQEPAREAKFNTTLLAIDVSGNSAITAPMQQALTELMAVRNGTSRKVEKPELTEESTVEDVVAWAKRVAKISPAAVEVVQDNKLCGADILELASLDQRAIEEELQGLGFTRGASVMLAKAIHTGDRKSVV